MTALTDLDAAIAALGTAQSKLAAVRTVLAQPAPVPTPTPPPPTPPPPPSGVGPSGIAMPTTPPAGWRRVLDDDFADWTCPLGSFPTSASSPNITSNGKWSSYPHWGIGGGSPHAMYDSERVVSVHDHVLDQWFHSENVGGTLKFLSAAIQPRVNGHEIYSYGMRVSVCWRVPVPFGSYKAAWLLWPQSETWPRDGEIDFPEAAFNGHIGGYMHRMNGTSGGDQDAWETSTPVGTVWHVSTREWKPGSCQFFDNYAGSGPRWTNRVPSTPMRHVIQSACYSEANPAEQGHVLIDWITIEVPA